MKAVLRGEPARRAIAVSRREAERLRFWAGPQGGVSRRSGRISPDYYCMDGTIPRKRLGRGAAAHRRDGEEVRPALRQRVPRRRRQPASADPVRRQRRRTSSSAPKPSAPRSSSCASRSAAPSPASTASASRRSTQMCVQFGAAELDAFLAVKRAFDPAGPAQSRARRCRRCTAAPSTARMHVHARAAASSPTCRASDGMTMHRTILQRASRAPRPRQQRAAAHPRRRHQGFLRRRARAATCSTRAAIAGIVDYEPTELVITARCRHAAGRARGGAARARPDAAVRAAAFRRRRDARRLRRRRPVRARAAPTAGALRDFVLGVDAARRPRRRCCASAARS